jgi:hypothetical protein
MTWRSLRRDITVRLADAGIIPAVAEADFSSSASGFDADEWLEIADVDPPARRAAPP